MPAHDRQAAQSSSPSGAATKVASSRSELTEVQTFIASELAALANGDLRREDQVKALFRMLPEGTPEQIAEAERLKVGLLVNGSPLQQLPSLGINIELNEDGTKRISYYEVLRPRIPFTKEQLNPTTTDSPLFTNGVEMKLLGSVEDARGITPRHYLMSEWPNKAARERMIDLIGEQSRLTFHRGIPVTWDKNVDDKAWSTNIDTVFFSDWLRASGALNERVRVSAEIGCGAGGISQAVLANCPNLKKHVYTDIDPNAITCARRNLLPLKGDSDLSWLIGKGITGIVEPGTLDLLVTNPPYIPTPTGDGDIDHYSGTKLIKRIMKEGIPLLNPKNPEAAIYIQMSSVTLPDFERYQKEHPEIEVTRIGTPVRVPLRISGLLRQPEILEFVLEQGGLEYIENDPLQYYHEIMAFRLRPKR